VPDVDRRERLVGARGVGVEDGEGGAWAQAASNAPAGAHARAQRGLHGANNIEENPFPAGPAMWRYDPRYRAEDLSA
jgi:hypothetical protein